MGSVTTDDAVVPAWVLGDWRMGGLREVSTEAGSALVVGSCNASDIELAHLIGTGGRDDVAWRWSGSYSLGLFTTRGVTWWTDLGGHQPIYTRRTVDGVYWANSSWALASLGLNSVDVSWLAAWLYARRSPELTKTRTAFGDVNRVPPGSRLDISRAGDFAIVPVWSPADRCEDHVARLRSELSAAVATRVLPARAPTADLSGGYDSTALALLAGMHLAPERRIRGVTLHPDGITTGGDLTYATQAAAHPGIEHHLFGLTSDHLPYSRLDDLPVTDEPAPSTISYAYFAAQLDWMASEFGTDCHLTGDGGDSLLNTPPMVIPDLLATRRYGPAIAEAMRWTRFRQQPLRPLLKSAWRIAHTDPASAYRDLAVALREGTKDPLHNDVAWVPEDFPLVAVPSLVAGRLAEMADAAAADMNPLERGEGARYWTAAMMGDVGRTAHCDRQLADHHQVAVHNPFADSRVIDTYLSIPLTQRPSPSDYKPVLRQALGDLYPAALMRRRTKGTFATDFYQGMRANLHALLDLLDGHLAATDLVNTMYLQKVITETAAGSPRPLSSVEPFIAAEVWLRTIAAHEPLEWERAQAPEAVA